MTFENMKQSGICMSYSPNAPYANSLVSRSTQNDRGLAARGGKEFDSIYTVGVTRQETVDSSLRRILYLPSINLVRSKKNCNTNGDHKATFLSAPYARRPLLGSQSAAEGCLFPLAAMCSD